PVFETTAVSLSGTQWTLVSLVDDQGETVPVLEGSAVTMEFSEERVLGNGGCNDYATTYESGAGAISVAPVGVTRQTCPEPEGVMDQELAFLGVLREAGGYRVDEDKLMLLDVDGGLLATFTVAGPGTIVGVMWQWIDLVEADPTMESLVPDPDRPAVEPEPGLYTLVLQSDGTYEAQADCHQVGGEYELVGSSLTLGVDPVALAECGPESLFEIYLTSLFSVESASLEQGRLVLQVTGTSQRMVFRSAGLAGEPSD
ncbi:MAG: META domain-containing protein, partial [Anaerolineae bacterium]